jgi:hypothetical protein
MVVANELRDSNGDVIGSEGTEILERVTPCAIPPKGIGPLIRLLVYTDVSSEWRR